jgi:hypothetical protein
VIARLLAAAAVGGVGLLLTACQSTQDKARALAVANTTTIEAAAAEVAEQGERVEVTSADILRGDGTTVAAVTVRNLSSDRRVRLPVSIDVRDAAGKTVFQNNIPGIGETLTEVSVLRPRERMTWINDQINATGTPETVRAVVGDGRPSPKSPPPRITLQRVRQVRDGGTPAVTGYVKNKSDVEQIDLAIHAVFTRGERVVAAGRAVVPLLAPAARERFDILLVGNPRGARMDLAVPPTVLR